MPVHLWMSFAQSDRVVPNRRERRAAMGGKPNKGTKKDKRIKKNKR